MSTKKVKKYKAKIKLAVNFPINTHRTLYLYA